MVPSIATPARPASTRYIRPRPPPRTRRTGVTDQKIQTGAREATNRTSRCAGKPPTSPTRATVCR
jgi:hypothetical protein